MLVLTRKLNEQIQIGDHIKVSILRIKGNTVRVGIEAPRQVRVVRGELPPKSVPLAGVSERGPERTGNALDQDELDAPVELRIGVEALEMLAHLSSQGDLPAQRGAPVAGWSGSIPSVSTVR